MGDPDKYTIGVSIQKFNRIGGEVETVANLEFPMADVQRQLSSTLYDRDKVEENQSLNITDHAIKRFMQRIARYNIKYNEATAEICKCLNEDTRRYRYLGKENNKVHGLTYQFFGEYNGIQYVVLLSYIGCVYTILTMGMAQYSSKDIINSYMDQYAKAMDEAMAKTEM